VGAHLYCAGAACQKERVCSARPPHMLWLIVRPPPWDKIYTPGGEGVGVRLSPPQKTSPWGGLGKFFSGAVFFFAAPPWKKPLFFLRPPGKAPPPEFYILKGVFFGPDKILPHSPGKHLKGGNFPGYFPLKGVSKNSGTPGGSPPKGFP